MKNPVKLHTLKKKRDAFVLWDSDINTRFKIVHHSGNSKIIYLSYNLNVVEFYCNMLVHLVKYDTEEWE